MTNMAPFMGMNFHTIKSILNQIQYPTMVEITNISIL